MSKGAQTKEHIIEQAAGLFNRQGFSGASISDVMEATGLQKGGIYRHFESKEALAVEAFDFAVGQMRARFGRAMAGKQNAVDRLHAIIGVFGKLPMNPPVPGGCPILNASVEHDDGVPVLREHARRAMNGLRGLIRRTAEEGISRGEVRPDVDADELATVLTATLEGGVMLTRLYDDARHMQRAVDHLTQSLERNVRV